MRQVKRFNGFIYDIMRWTRHQYNYAVRRQKRRKTEIQKLKLAENVSFSKEFWNELKKINPANKVTAYSVDNVNIIKDKEFADKFEKKI